MQTNSTLTLYVNQMYGSKHLTEVLFVLGVGSSVIEFNSFTHILFYNADFDVRIILRNGFFK